MLCHFTQLYKHSSQGLFHLQVAAYAGLDIAAKVFFGWMVMAVIPIVSKQQEREYKE